MFVIVVIVAALGFFLLLFVVYSVYCESLKQKTTKLQQLINNKEKQQTYNEFKNRNMITKSKIEQFLV